MNKKEIFKYDGTDKLFNYLKNENNILSREGKIFVEDLWEKTHAYLDQNLTKDLRSDCHSRFWEMYLAATQLDLGKRLEKGRSEGPDICIEKSVDLPKIWVEAVTATKGTTEDAVFEIQPKVGISVLDNQTEEQLAEKIKLRLTSVFDKKFKQFNKYISNQIICDGQPCIIAINAARVPMASFENDDVPIIVKALLPFGNQNEITVNRYTLEVDDYSYSYKDFISKAKGDPVATTAFSDAKYSKISAVIYSCVDVFDAIFNDSKDLTDKLLVFHNPLAQNRLPLGYLKCKTECWVDSEGFLNIEN